MFWHTRGAACNQKYVWCIWAHMCPGSFAIAGQALQNTKEIERRTPPRGKKEAERCARSIDARQPSTGRWFFLFVQFVRIRQFRGVGRIGILPTSNWQVVPSHLNIDPGTACFLRLVGIRTCWGHCNYRMLDNVDDRPWYRNPAFYIHWPIIILANPTVHGLMSLESRGAITYHMIRTPLVAPVRLPPNQSPVTIDEVSNGSEVNPLPLSNALKFGWVGDLYRVWKEMCFGGLTPINKVIS